MIIATSSILYLAVLGITIPISSVHAALQWDAVGFTNKVKSIFEDEPVNEKTPLLHVKWNEDAKDCKDFEYSVSSADSLKNKLTKVYNDGDREAKLYSEKPLYEIDKNLTTISLTLKLKCAKGESQDFTIFVSPVNLHDPKIHKQSTQKKYFIAENTLSTPLIETLYATDEDMNRGFQMPDLTIQLKGENEGDQVNEYFAISHVRNKTWYEIELKLKKELDYETQNRYELRILVEDMSETRPKPLEKRTDEITLPIEVLDVHDQDPQFTKDCPLLKVDEASELGREITKMTARDGDSNVKPKGTFKYTLVGDDHGIIEEYFEIDEKEGTLKVKKPPILTEDKLKNLDDELQFTIKATEYDGKTGIVEKNNAIVTTLCNLKFIDIDNNPPRFERPKYTANIDEHSRIETTVNLDAGDFVITDEDKGVNAEFKISLETVTPSIAKGMFKISPVSGREEAEFSVKVNNDANLEFDGDVLGDDKKITLKLKAVGKNDTMRHEVSLEIRVNDINDNSPNVTSGSSAEIKENSLAGTELTTVKAFDIDSGKFGDEGLRYYIPKSSALKESFDIDEISGKITLKEDNKIDREVQEEHILPIEVIDNEGVGNKVNHQITVTVLDDNDQKPVFQIQNFNQVYNENDVDLLGTVKLEAKDMDKNGTDNSKVEYYLMNYETFFEIGKDDGEFKLRDKLDFEEKNPDYPKAVLNTKSKVYSRTFLIVARANDCGFPKQYSDPDATIKVEFMDINDNVPKFVNRIYATAIEEIAKPKEKINVTVKAVDGDFSPAFNKVTYSIDPEKSSSHFLVDRQSGEITVAPGADLAPESNDGVEVFNLTVLATDGLSEDEDEASTCVVTVNVIDVNNKKPIFTETENVILSFKEEDPNPIELGKFVAVDVDKDNQIEYRINFTESSAKSPRFSPVDSNYNWQKVFAIDSETGVLTATKADREKMKTAILIVEAEDMNFDHRFPNQIVKITKEFTVIDINDHAPLFLNNNGEDNGPKGTLPVFKTEVEEHENRPNLFKIEATDEDEANVVSFSIEPYQGNDIKYFSINATTGYLNMSPVDYDEGIEWMNVTVKATDNGEPPLSSLAYVTVRIIDKNDHAPEFVDDVNYTIYRPENEALGTVIFTLNATDKDQKDDYGVVNYRFRQNNNDNDFFNLNVTTGELSIKTNLDFETNPKFIITVEAYDNPKDKSNQNTAQKEVILHLTDVNDNAPVFQNVDKELTCDEDYQLDRIIEGRVYATDIDSGENQVIEYSIVSVDQRSEHFAVNKDSGEVRVRKNLTNIPSKLEQPDNHIFKIEFMAKDKGDPSMNSTAIYTIKVNDINNNRPYFIKPDPAVENVYFVHEDYPKGPVTEVEAFDLDLGDNGNVTCTLTVRDSSTNEIKNDFFDLKRSKGKLQLEVVKDVEKKETPEYVISLHANDNGKPSLSADDLRLKVKIISEDDKKPQFSESDAKTVLKFTENSKPGEEVRIIPEANYPDHGQEPTKEQDKPKICYHIIEELADNNDKSATEGDYFTLDKELRKLTVKKSLDRETHAYHHVVVRAQACNDVVINKSLLKKPDMLNITIKVLDVNDNPPVFEKDLFTSGVSTNTKEGKKILTVKATDADEGENAVVSYSIFGPIETSETENVQNINNPFIVDKQTGDVNVTFNIAKNMKGHFSFTVLAEDKDKLNDTATVKIYFMREDQQVILTVAKPVTMVTDDDVSQLTSVIRDITKYLCNFDEKRQYEGSQETSRNYTDIYVHFVDNTTQKVLEPDEALRLVNRHFMEISSRILGTLTLLDAHQAGQKSIDDILTEQQIRYILIGACAALLIAFAVSFTLFCLNIASLKRNLKAATATAFGSQESGLNRVGVKSAPNTNQHTVEGSNPVWNQKEEIIYNEEGSLYDSETLSMKSYEDRDDEYSEKSKINPAFISDYSNEPKINPAFVNDEDMMDQQFQNELNRAVTPQIPNEAEDKKQFKKNTVNTLRQIDKDWRRRHTQGELQVDELKKKNDMMSVFDLPDQRRRQSTFISPIPTSEL